MNAPTTRKGPQALDIKSATLHTVRLVLHSADTHELLEALDWRMQEAGAFFQDEPVVIDCSAVTDPIDWAALIHALRQHQLHPIGVCGHPDQERDAASAGLAAVELAATRATIEPTADLTPTVSMPAAPIILRKTLRSGQRIYAPDGDVVVIGMVGQGAEVIATGNVYVYGPLRGKAVAGAQGNTEAFIAATEYDPELIAIAGVYSVIENPESNPHHKQSVMIQLDGESLRFEPLG
ncbi:MAG TPA: septum site-determining protein MinC [Paenalcaligenes hominis]|uniref:Probable septum site-determining protein MinC n=1 Tax=Paenalcaligenes hominis TaxID=643674 RepID=A0A9D3AAI9_9BURK|nr:septum site-determining protein MinC [Paenalcaligenes hominis]